MIAKRFIIATFWKQPVTEKLREGVTGSTLEARAGWGTLGARRQISDRRPIGASERNHP